MRTANCTESKRRRLLLAAGLLCGIPQAIVACTAFADESVRIRLGTLAPKGSSYHRALQEMGEKWRKAQGGAASFTVFTDGTQGGEEDTVRRMRVGQLNAALLSVVGLKEIDRSVAALQLMPLVYRSWEEVDYVREKIASKLEKSLFEKGYVVLFWADAGWVRYFSKEPALLPGDFRRRKIFVWSGDNNQVNMLKAMGYQPVPLETADILPGLQTGLITVIPTTPFYALAGQFNGPAPHMLDMKWVPIVGACVITRKGWEMISPLGREELMRAAQQAGADIRRQARQEDTESIEAMKRRGLQVAVPTPEIDAEWRRVAEQAYPGIRGSMVPAEIFDEVMALLRECRGARQ
jgi:TRAP-type C4-dicarboxylate transport system substrate-binding protein